MKKYVRNLELLLSKINLTDMSLSSVAMELSNLVKDNENLIVGSFDKRKNIIEFTDIY